jgi:hypothetical protein
VVKKARKLDLGNVYCKNWKDPSGAPIEMEQIPERTEVESQPPAHWFSLNPNLKPTATLLYTEDINFLILGRFILDNLGGEALTLDMAIYLYSPLKLSTFIPDEDPDPGQVPQGRLIRALNDLTNRVSKLEIIFFFYELYFFQVARLESQVSNIDHYPILVRIKLDFFPFQQKQPGDNNLKKLT